MSCTKKRRKHTHLSEHLSRLEIPACECKIEPGPICLCWHPQGCIDRREDGWCACKIYAWPPCRHVWEYFERIKHEMPETYEDWGQWLESDFPGDEKLWEVLMSVPGKQVKGITDALDGYKDLQPRHPTDSIPGTAERIEVFCERARLRQNLFHRDDNDGTRREGRAVRLTYSRNGKGSTIGAKTVDERKGGR